MRSDTTAFPLVKGIGLFVCLLSIFSVLPLRAAPRNQQLPTSRLQLFETHTGERIDIVYRQGKDYISGSLEKLDYFLRDYRTGKVHQFDPKLFDLLEKLTVAVGHPGGEIDIICGYRTPWTNDFLRAHTAGVAKHSLHMQAEAIDIRMPGVRTSRLRQAAIALHRGGVGYYPHSNFVHVDVGRIRQWCFECSAKQAAGD
jgi:uncharacterized protein YcbK (DUF882 family)